MVSWQCGVARQLFIKESALVAIDEYAPVTKRIEECGCEVEWTPGYQPFLDQWRIIYCVTHRAALEFMKAWERYYAGL